MGDYSEHSGQMQKPWIMESLLKIFNQEANCQRCICEYTFKQAIKNFIHSTFALQMFFSYPSSFYFHFLSPPSRREK